MPESKDTYHWRAWYGDGTYLDEHDEDGEPHQFEEIDQDLLTEFQLMPQREGLPIHGLHLSQGRRLIWYRVSALDANGPMANIPRTLHVMGWQTTVNGVNVKDLIAVTDGGTVFVTDCDELVQP